jgi:hypothetical protein
MEKAERTQGTWIVSPVNSNLIISKETQECVSIVMSGKYNGLAFPENRQVKQANAKLIAMAPEMLDFLEKFVSMLPKSIDTLWGDTYNNTFESGISVGQKIHSLIKSSKL